MAFGETLREFGVKISLNFDKKKIEDAQNKIDKFGEQMRRFSLEVVAGAAAIFEFANLSTSNARGLQQNADLLGLNVENLQQLQYAAKVAAGVTGEELVGALQSVSETLDRARHGEPEALGAFSRLADLSGNADEVLRALTDTSITSDQVMMTLSKSFQNLKDPIAAARLATEAFGGAGAKLLPFLKQGPEGIAKLRKEGRDLGLIFSKKQIDQGAAMDREFTKVWEVLKHISYTMGFEIAKAILPTVRQFEKFVLANRKLIVTNVVAFIKAMAQALILVFTWTGKAIGVAQYFIDKLGGMERVARVLLAVFVGFRAITIFGSMLSTFISIASVVGALIPSFAQLAAVFSAIGEAISWIGAIGGLADIFPAIIAAAGGLLTALAPILGPLAAIAAAAVAIHDIIQLIQGANFSDTLTGTAVNKVGGWISSAKNLLTGSKEISAKNQAYANVTPNNAAGAGGVNQENTFNSNVTVQVPQGTTAAQGAAMVSKAHITTHEEMMRKAKIDAQTARQQ